MIERTGLAVAVLLAGLMAAPSTPRSSELSHASVQRTLKYCNGQELDLYIPHAPVDRPLPVVIYVHGGGMTAGDKSDLNPMFQRVLVSDGYAVVSLDYRLAPEFRFPAQLEDVKCAVRYLRAKARTYNLNAGEMFAFGTSVGGELVALAALTGSHSAFDVGPYAGELDNLRAVVDMFGPANLTQASGFSASDIQQVFGSRPTEVVLASPTHFVSPKAPPILLIQGESDTKVLKSQSIELYSDLKAAGDQAQLILVRNMGHMFMQVGAKPLDPDLREIAGDMVTFFDGVRRSSS
jgi:acetyl esterase/lipase